MGFTADDTLVTTDDNGHGYTWNLASRRPTPIGYAQALRLTSVGSTTHSQDGSLSAVPEGSNVIEVQDIGAGKSAALTEPRARA